MERWSTKRVLITVRTYPVPARKGIEVSCTGGITADGKWIRLFPVPYRFLDDDKRFTKYQWIELSVTKARNDARPESYRPNLDTLKICGALSSADNWRARREIIRPLLKRSLCEIERERAANKSPTLGAFKPAKIDRLLIEDAAQPNWTTEQLNSLRQIPLFQNAPQEASI